VAWRDDVLCELDYGFRPRAPGAGARTVAVPRGHAAHQGVEVRALGGLPPQLFDLTRDPLELADLGAASAYESVRQSLRERLLDKLATLRHRITVDDAEIAARTDNHRERGHSHRHLLNVIRASAASATLPTPGG
jgi:hypothetical protein